MVRCPTRQEQLRHEHTERLQCNSIGMQWFQIGITKDLNGFLLSFLCRNNGTGMLLNLSSR